MEDLVRKAKKTGMAHSKFMTTAESVAVEQAYRNRKDVILLLDGGYADAERQLAVFVNPDWGAFERDEVLCGLILKHRVQDTIRHQDVLGAVLGLGISRDVVGDIVIEQGRASMVCLASMATFISSQLTKVARVGVQTSTISVEELPSVPLDLREKTTTVSSMRLDAVICAALNCSRSSAADWIQSGKVQLSHQECLSISKEVENGAVVSVRGQGRIKLLSVNYLTRKGKMCITIGIY